MKKIIGFLMAVVMCLGIITPITAFAENDAQNTTASSALTTDYSTDFSNVTIKSAESGSHIDPDWVLSKGTVTVDDGTLNFGDSNDANASTVDFYFGSTLKSAVSEKNLYIAYDFYRSENNASDNFEFCYKDSGGWVALWRFNAGNIEYKDGENTWIKPKTHSLSADWNSVEIVFYYNDTLEVIDSYSIYLNGTPFRDANNDIIFGLARENWENVQSFRFQSTNKKFFNVDNLVIAHSSSYENLSNGFKYFYNDFEDHYIDTTDGTINKTGASKNGVESLSGNCSPANSAASSINEGILKLDTAGSSASRGEYLIQLYKDMPKYGFVIRGDITVSLSFKPCEGYRSSNLMTLTEFDGSNYTNVNVIKFTQGGVMNNINTSDRNKFGLSTEEYHTVELMLTYDWTQGFYTSADCYVNGEYFLTQSIADKGLNYINYFKMAQVYDAGHSVDVDFVSVAKGHNSLYVAPQEPEVIAKTQLVGYQTTGIVNNKFNLRLVAVMTDENYSQYQKVGFKVKATYGETELNKTQDITTIYQSIVANEGCDYTEYTAEELGGKYIFALNCKNVPSNAGNITFEVTTYYQLVGSDVVEEKTVTFTVDPATDVAQPDVK